MSYFLLILYFVVLTILVFKARFFQSDKLSSKWVWLIFVSKFIAGLFLWAIYAFLYEGRATGDIFKYFDDGNIIFSALRENPMDYFRMISGIGSDAPYLMKYYDTCSFWIKEFNYGLINDNRLVIRFNAIVRLISMGNIHIHTLVMSFLSFTGLWSIYKVFEKRLNVHSILLVAAIFYFPSVLFWTSGLLKEGLLTLGFGLMFYHFSKLISNEISKIGIVVFLLAVILLIFSKFYVLLAAIPGVLYLLLDKKTKIKSLALKLLISHGIFILIAWFSESIFGLSFPKILAVKQNDFVTYANSLAKVGSLIEMPLLEPTFKSIVVNIPQALINSFARPTIFESHNLFMGMAAIENLIVVIGIVLSILFFDRKSLQKPLFWFSLSFVFVLFALIGLTTPILGALVRYKVPALPFLGLVFIYIINGNKLESFIKKISPWQK